MRNSCAIVCVRVREDVAADAVASFKKAPGVYDAEHVGNGNIDIYVQPKDVDVFADWAEGVTSVIQ